MFLSCKKSSTYNNVGDSIKKKKKVLLQYIVEIIFYHSTVLSTVWYVYSTAETLKQSVPVSQTEVDGTY